jgi:hypothetical protein
MSTAVLSGIIRSIVSASASASAVINSNLYFYLAKTEV